MTKAKRPAALITHKDISDLARGAVKEKMRDMGLSGATKPEPTLFLWFVLYMQLEIIGVKAKATEAAKWQDMGNFLRWYEDVNGHLAIESWLKRDTAGFLDHLEAKKRKPATINRAHRTLCTFVRWLQKRADSPLRDDPVHPSMERSIGKKEPSKIDDRVMWSLLKAADNLILTESRIRNARPIRNRAILVLLQETGLRVSELCNLEFAQYEGKYLRDVKRKGKRVDDVYVPKKARGPLEEYLSSERGRDSGKGKRAEECLFLSGRNNKDGGRKLSRRSVANLLDKLAAEAGKYSDEGIEIHPHMLRHTYGSKVMKKTSSESQTAEFLGHASTKYTGMYIGLTKQEREDLLDEE